MTVHIVLSFSLLLASLSRPFSADAAPSNRSGAPIGKAEPWRERYYAGEPLRLGQRTQLLMDDYAVEDTFNLRRAVGPVEKHPGNPLSMGPDLAWEKAWDESWSSPTPTFSLRNVIYDPTAQLYKGWGRMVLETKPGAQPSRHVLASVYAESRDGIGWTKPELDSHPVAGRRTNLVLFDPKGEMDGVSFYHDLAATDPARRFQAMVRMKPPGHDSAILALMISTDGRQWTLPADYIISSRKPDDGSYSLTPDPDRNGWLLYVRPSTSALERGSAFYAGVSAHRKVSVRMSQDLKTWTESRSISILHEGDDARHRMLGNPMDVDAVKVVRYGDLFIGFIGLMDNLGMQPQQSSLIWSRDGLEFQRLHDLTPFLETGISGEWDAGEADRLSLVPDHADRNRLRVYYQGNAVPQKDDRVPRMMQTGLAFLGRDRFVGWKGPLEGGRLLTRQFVLEGNRLEINCRSTVRHPPSPEWSPEIRAEILRPADEKSPKPGAEAIPGFTLADCDPVRVTDDFERIITWKGSSDLSRLRGQTVLIRFSIRSATLYTFRLAD